MLVVGINKNEEIIQFNRKCEKITGYDRKKVLNKKIWNTLIPAQYTNQWKDMFDAAIQDKTTIKRIPWITSNGNEISIAWKVFPIKNENNLIDEICIVGEEPKGVFEKQNTIMNAEETHKKLENKKNEKPLPNTKENTKDGKEKKETQKETTIKKQEFENEISKQKVSNQKEDSVTYKFGDKKIKFTKKPNQHTDKRQDQNNKKQTPIIKKSEEPIVTNEVKELIKDLDKKYNKVSEQLIKLEKKDRKLGRENKRLRKNIKRLRSQFGNKKIKIDKPHKLEFENQKDMLSIKKPAPSKKFTGFNDLFGVKRNRLEFERRLCELEEQKTHLDELEKQIMSDKRNVNAQRNAFFKWKDKLETLEEEIEKRREELVLQEKNFNDYLFNSLTKENEEDHEEIIEDKERDDVDEHHDILDKIPECAAIVQRGIFKQINNSFEDLIGYNSDELIEKSLLDFVVPEGFSEIEKYYLDRLKGVSSTSYETVFLAKDGSNVSVEVSIKQTVFNGEKAEIAVFKRLDTTQVKEEQLEQEEETVNLDDKVEDNQLEVSEEQISEDQTDDKQTEDNTTEINPKEKIEDSQINDSQLKEEPIQKEKIEDKKE